MAILHKYKLYVNRKGLLRPKTEEPHWPTEQRLSAPGSATPASTGLGGSLGVDHPETSGGLFRNTIWGRVVRGRTRTCDLPLFRRILYQLSYPSVSCLRHSQALVEMVGFEPHDNHSSARSSRGG